MLAYTFNAVQWESKRFNVTQLNTFGFRLSCFIRFLVRDAASITNEFVRNFTIIFKLNTQFICFQSNFQFKTIYFIDILYCWNESMEFSGAYIVWKHTQTFFSEIVFRFNVAERRQMTFYVYANMFASYVCKFFIFFTKSTSCSKWIVCKVGFFITFQCTHSLKQKGIGLTNILGILHRRLWLEAA